MNEKKEKKYNIGLDIGTSSVGWAVVEVDTQKILKKGKNQTPLWGVRLFDDASTAKERRSFRSTRRRYDRRRERIKLLQEEFKNEINLVDSNFFQKMKESKYLDEDNINKTIHITKEELNEVRQYYNEYPTIYHLRNKLITSDEKVDIRLVYLAIHHMIKYRGNFIYQGNSFKINDLNIEEEFKNVLCLFAEFVIESEIDENYIDKISKEEIEGILLSVSKNDVKVKIKELLSSVSSNNKFISEFVKYIVGNKFSINKLFCLNETEEDISINLDGTDYEEKFDTLVSALGDKISILEEMKKLYDMIFLKKIFKGSANVNLSSMMVERYNQHKEDLKFLKKVFDNDRKNYNKLLRSGKELCTYDLYIRNKITNTELISEIKKYLPSNLDGYDKKNFLRMENGNFLPRITDTENGRYPYQLNKEELINIIEKQGKYYPFLLNKTNDGVYKIVKLLEFKIPYYVGPLNKNSQFSWLERKVNEKITPYNFDEVVDKEVTAEKFIKRMISHCTYLNDKVDSDGNVIEVNYALPNCSILYSKFKVMNELKQIRINGDLIENEIQHEIMKDLFMKTNGSITENKFKEYLNRSSDFDAYEGDFNITGYSAEKKFANNMQPYIDFFGNDGIFNNTKYGLDDAEQIIEWVTIFEDKEILENKVRDKYLDLDDKAINKILRLKYSGWGNLSKRLLCDLLVKDKKTGLSKSIMDYMEETKENFMQILNNDEYGFQKLIAEYNHLDKNVKLNYELVANLATSPATKRGIYQALKVVNEIVKTMGYDPDCIMVEMARENENSGRKEDRKTYLKKLYENNKNQISNYNMLYNQLNSFEKIDSQKLFLYFIQEGKCLYSGRSINIDELMNSEKYEVDHIIPRTLIADDSIDNKALVYRDCNQKKAANFVLPSEYNNPANRYWWEHLKKINLMSAKKFHNLIRKEYSDDDIAGFINRQLVETRQITKHVANILNSLFSKSKVIYLKANLSHNYREKNLLYKFREINDFHHAHDAYLAVVLGEYKEKYMKKNIDFESVKELNHIFYERGEYNKLKYGYVINCLDDGEYSNILKITKNFIDEKTGEVIFDVSRFNNVVQNTLYRNDILISKKTEIKTGEFYNQTKNSKGKAGVPLKKNMPTSMYGSYTSLKPSYAVMVEYGKETSKKKKMVGIPIFIQKYNEINEYLRDLLKLKDNETVTVISKKIPFYSYINWNNQLCYLVGASDKAEVINAKQFYYGKKFYIDHKDTLFKLFIKQNFELDEQLYIRQLKEIIKYIVDKIEKEYILYNNLLDELKTIVKYYENFDYSVDKLENIIKQLTKLLNCKSEAANFKFLDSSSGFGRKHCRIIESCIIINKNVIDTKETSYEF